MLLPDADEGEVVDEVSAIEWLRRLLERKPMMLGEIKPLWMRATVRLTSDLSTQLERIIRENFWLDRAGNTWREPTTEERRRMDTTERDRIRHNADRLLAGSIKQMPPETELCRWIGILYDAAKAVEEEQAALTDGPADRPPPEALAGYRQIQGLFQRILKEKVPAKPYATAARQARMAAIRLQLAQESEPKQDEQTVMLFD